LPLMAEFDPSRDLAPRADTCCTTIQSVQRTDG
jgi:hypothetical protein